MTAVVKWLMEWLMPGLFASGPLAVGWFGAAGWGYFAGIIIGAFVSGFHRLLTEAWATAQAKRDRP